MEAYIPFKNKNKKMEAYILPESALPESRPTEALQRWRSTGKLLISRRRSGAATIELQTKAKEENKVGATEQLRRPREALSIASISSRAFSQVKKIIVENQDAYNRLVLRSSSYTSINVEPECFRRIDKSLLAKLAKEKMTDQLHHQFGGVPGVFSMLQTHVENGIEVDAPDISSRIESFGSNTIQMPSAKMLQIALATLKDPIFVLLLLTALLCMGFGIKRDGDLSRVSDALFIIVSLFIVMAVICLCNTWAMRQFHALSKSNYNISTLVIRDGRKQQISINDVVVGDLVYLQIGDQVPADGLYVEGYPFQVTESSDLNSVPFLLSGSKVRNGYGRMLVTAVGMDTKWGEMMSLKCPTAIKTPLQVKLHKLARNTTKVSLTVASMVLMVLLIQYFTGNMKDDSGAVEYTSSKSIHHVFRDIVGILVAPIVIASTNVPEGLLLAVTISLAYSAKRTTTENAIVRNLAAFERIGSLTVLCVDKSSISTQEVEQLRLGQMNSSTKQNRPSGDEVVLQLLREGIGLNTSSGSSSEFNELQAEKAIHAWAVQVLGMDIAQLKLSCSVLDADKVNLQKKQGHICIKRNGEKRVYAHINGSIDIILGMCSHYYKENGEVGKICADVRRKFEEVSHDMKNDGLNCIAYAHAAISRNPEESNDDKHVHPRLKDLTLIGFLGLRDLFRPNLVKALKECQQAGVKVKMITTEGFSKARESAVACGIFSPDQIIKSDDIIEFRKNPDDQERLKKVERFSVVARACMSDKLLLVKCLKQKGHGVAVVGGFPGDEEVFEEADVSFFPGIQESQFMMEKSDIIILDGSFTTISSVVRRARGMHNNIQTFALFQLIVTLTSLVTDSVTTIFGGEPPTINIVAAISSGKIPFAALQILWVKLIVGTLLVLALSIDDPTESLVQLMPMGQRGAFVTNIMWRDIIGQSLWQITILLSIQFQGESTFKLTSREKDTVIFNILVLCQIFNTFNRVSGKNIYEILTKKTLFWMVMGIIILLQVVIVELFGKFAGTERLNWKHWRGCIAIAITSWVVGWILKKIPVPE